MRILFHDNALSIRGTTVALFDYAFYNEKMFGNESFIAHSSTHHANDNYAISKFKNFFPEKVLTYKCRSEMKGICEKLDIDVCYIIKSGENDGFMPAKKNVIHAVFQAHQPHGDVYAYVSEWLSKKATGGRVPFVPHMVNLPKPTGTIREQLGIPADALVFGRHGGMNEFDIPFAKEAVVEFAKHNEKSWFIFMNTMPFADHPRILFIDGTVDLQAKSNFIHSCDAMIHARARGESFGLAVCEFLHGDKPVLAWAGGEDLNHAQILRDCGTLYNDKKSLLDLMHGIGGFVGKKHSEAVADFSPEAVMDKFNRVFLETI